MLIINYDKPEEFKEIEMTDEEIINALSRINALKDYGANTKTRLESYTALNKAIKALQPEETAQWIWDDSRFQYVCSNCNRIPTMKTGCALSIQELNKEYLYCRWCGKRMVVK